MGVTILHGLPDPLRNEAAALYWEAFGGKLGRVLGPKDKALQFLNRVIRADQCLTAVNDAGQLQGLAGFQTVSGSFAGGTAADVRAVYGGFGAAWRVALLWSLGGGEVDNARFLLDGICVAERARGAGVGTALLTAICNEALARGFAAVRLEVVDINDRARTLYEREGFVAIRAAKLGPLRHVFGFGAAITMVREIPPPVPGPNK